MAGYSYRLETRASLEAGSWSPLGVPLVATGTTSTLAHFGGGNVLRRFYRVRVVAGP